MNIEFSLFEFLIELCLFFFSLKFKITIFLNKKIVENKLIFYSNNLLNNYFDKQEVT